MMAFGPNRVPAAPAGVKETEIVARFAGWDLAGTQPDSEVELRDRSAMFRATGTGSIRR